jgi:hypothetical protein
MSAGQLLLESELVQLPLLALQQQEPWALLQ